MINARVFIAIALLSLSACAYDNNAVNPLVAHTERSTSGGDVVGTVAENGALVWRGIPFAASTAGKNRWRAPQPAVAWQGVREAINPADRCAQFTNEFDEDNGLSPGKVVGSEDCLTLDIYTPPNSNSALPVMVWIHGGGNVWGSSASFDGSRLAVNENVIVVAVQYRLGPLGWFAHKLLRESAQAPEDAAASFATLDLIAALHWLSDNITAFGGNPDNLTLFGESAGGHNVVTLLGSPRAKGLFHRAIIQSGSFDSISLEEAQGNINDRPNNSNFITRKLDVTSVEQLRALPLGTFFAAFVDKPGFIDVPRVIEDGVALPRRPLRELFTSTSTFNAVPIVTGTTRDEMKLFYLSDNRLTKRSLGFLTVARDQKIYDTFTRYLTRLWRIRSVDEPAQMMTDAGHTAVYAYRFDWDDGGKLLTMNFKDVFGAAHGFEIPFVANKFQHLGDADRFLFQRRTLDDRMQLSLAMGGYWAAFARTGIPSFPGEPVWPAYGSANSNFIRFDTNNDGGIEVLHQSDSIEAVAADIASDPYLTSQERCMLVSDLGKWLFTAPIQSRIQAATDCPVETD